MELEGRQKEFVDAVAAGESYILVEAPAGTGKTFCCIQAARRIWMDRMIDGYQRILVLTFSRNARAQIIKELARVPEEEDLARHVDINNYHSFFKKYLDAYRDVLGIQRPLVILDDDEFCEALDKYAHENKYKLPHKLDCEMLDDYWLENGKSKCVNPESKHIKRTTDEICKYHMVATSFTEQTGNICFAQFGNLICKVIRRSPKIAEAISHDYPVLILDEYQDTNYYQEEFVRSISRNSKCIYFADGMQMIYGFRGSSVRRLKDLSYAHPSLKKIEFDQYYRYKDKPDLIEIMTTIRNGDVINYAAIRNGRLIICRAACNVNWENTKGVSNKAQCTSFCSGLYYSVVRDITFLLRNHKSVAILCRTNAVANRLSDVFFEHNLHPKSVSDTPDMLRLTKCLKKVFEYSGQVSDKVPAILSIAVLCTMNKKIDGEGYQELSAMSLQSLSRKRKPTLKRICAIISPYASSSVLSDVSTIVLEVLRLVSDDSNIAISYPRKRYVEHCTGVKNITPQIIDSIMLQRQYIDSFTGINPGLYISTIHQSKGKEFDCVFIIEPSSLKRDRNLLYVAHSRMKEKLFPIEIQYTGVNYGKR